MNREFTLCKAIRCTAITLAVMMAAALLPAEAQGGTCTPGVHGTGIDKQCVSPKNRCTSDLDCADANLCNGTEQCATETSPGSNILDCTITLTNPVTHCDDITITQAADLIQNGTGSPTSSSDILVSGTTGTVVGPGCDAGSNLGTPGTEVCTLSPGASISVRSNFYVVQPADPNPLNDQGTITVMDTCNNSPMGCNNTANGVQFSAATDTVSGCSGGTPLNCDDGLFCTDDSCVDATGCAHAAHPCPPNSDLCTAESCDETANACVSGPPRDCNDMILCTDDSCVPASGNCSNVFDPTNDPSCAPDEFCRTPGFWGTHADDDCVPLTDDCKACSQNITQEVLDMAPGGFIPICGEDICNTLVDDASSAVEAICMRVQGQITRQLARQLTAARLNCIVSGEGGGPCDGISINDLFDACNAACAAGDVEVMVGPDTVNCIDAIDCFNNGGMFDNASGDCTTGVCVVNGGLNGPNGAIPCGPDLLCAEGECVPFENNCHDAAFPDDFLPNDFLPDTDPCFEKQGPAGSSDECKAAHKTMCTVIQPNEDDCATEEVCD